MTENERPCPECKKPMTEIGSGEQVPQIDGTSTPAGAGLDRFQCDSGHVLFIDKAGQYYINENGDTSSPKGIALGYISELEGW